MARLFFLALIFKQVFAFSQRLELVKTDTALTGNQSLATVLMFVPTSFLMINMHEIGHTALAKLSGDRSAGYYFYRRDPRCIGCNFYDHTKLSRVQNVLVPLGGVVFSQSLAQLADLSLRNVPMSPFLQRTVALTYTVSKFDMSFQVLQGVLKANRFNNIVRYGLPSGTDMVDAAFYAANGNQRKFNWITFAFVALATTDIYLSRNQIKRNWRILANKQRYRRKMSTS